jgi:uncharacterized membrane protein YphA (DoxX/SURF4 family)
MTAETSATSWSLKKRIAFRFCLVYFGLYCLSSTQITANRLPFVSWTAAHVFGAKLPLVETGSGSGDKTFDWVQVFCFLVIGVVVAAAWSMLDRKREDYRTLDKWLRLVIRIALASTMISYGLDKVIPTQMPFPSLSRLLEPYGNFSPASVLWFSVGASPAYEIFTGCAELLGGVLLIAPRTALLGALISLADMTQVFMLNMTYDVPVKLLSFHLLLMAVFLLTPDLPRLANLFLLNRAALPRVQARLFGTARANRIALAAQLILGAWLVGLGAYQGIDGWKTFGGGSPKPILYGIWNVEEFSVDDQIRPPLLTDKERWRRVIFEVVNSMGVQQMDDSYAGNGGPIAVSGNSLTLTRARDKSRVNFTFERPAEDRLILDGVMDGHQVHMQLQLFDRNKFLLVNRGFHWVQEYPFYR